ncbi:MAG TPA: nucleotidyltransferase domain-containing protein [Actinomycetota bacterium]|nr:nucleotidyltransferase domain-containing protein [Actinomycetota bacterium]
MVGIAASIESLLLPHPAVRGVELVGSRADGSPTPLSDWDFVVVTDRFDDVARALPELVTPLDPLAQQWDRISDYPCFMLMLQGPVKVDLIFPEEPYESLPPWTVSVDTLDGIDQHFWDWILWLASKREKGQDQLVQGELVKMRDHLLRPMGVDRIPGSIEAAVVRYRSARDEWERELGIEVSRRREREVLSVLPDA